MKYRTLGKDFTVSAVGRGCMGMSHGYGKPRDKKEMTELLAQAVDFGYTFFDTAEVYGTPDNPHANETLLGEALKPFRNRIQIGTKFGIHFDLDSPATNKPIVTDARPEVIRQSVDASLQRLQTDHIDIYYQHRQDPKVPVEEVASVMADLIKEGKILHWGLSEVDADTLRRAHAVCPVTAVQNRYSMMARWYEPMFPVLEELNVGLVAFSPMANGLLSGRYDSHSHFEKGNGLPQHHAPVPGKEYGKESGTHPLDPGTGSPEECHAGPDFPGLDALQKALDRPHPGYDEPGPPQGKRRCRRHCPHAG